MATDPKRLPNVTITISGEAARELFAVSGLPRIVRADMSQQYRDEIRAALALSVLPVVEPQAEKPRERQEDIEREFDERLAKDLQSKRKYGA